MGRVFACLLMVLGGGCSLVLGEDALGLPLTGPYQDLSSVKKLNNNVAQASRLMIAPDGANWAAIQEYGSVLHLVRLSGTPQEVSLTAGDIHVYQRAYFLIDPTGIPIQADDGGPGLILVGQPGDKDGGRQIRVPAHRALLIPGGAGRVFLYYVQSPDTTTFRIIRTDGSYEREVPVPAGVDPSDPLGKAQLFFDGVGDRLFVRDGTGELIMYSTIDDRMVDMGPRPPMIRLDEGRQALLFCGADGFRRVSYDGRDSRLLDPESCVSPWVFLGSDAAYLEWNGVVRRVPLDGGAPGPVYMGPAQQILAVLSDGRLVLSQDGPNRYVNNASDGWLDDWQFMERGRRLSVSSDGKRLRFLEHAAQEQDVGDLTAADIAGRDTLLLARNVQKFEELPDGRILALSNAAYPGPQNRVIVIDEKAGLSSRVAEGVGGVNRIPGTNDVLLNAIAGPEGYDLMRVTLPAH